MHYQQIVHLVIGSSILRNVRLELPVAIVKCIPEVRVGNVESNLKLLAKAKRKYNEEHGQALSYHKELIVPYYPTRTL